MTVNIGIAPNRLLAKMASDFEKPDKVHTLFQRKSRLRCGRYRCVICCFWEKLLRKKLTEAGIRTIGDMAHVSESEIQHY